MSNTKKFVLVTTCLFSLVGVLWAADIKISALTLKGTPVGADTTIIVDSVGGANKKITLGTIPAGWATSLIGGNGTTLLGSIPYQSGTDTTTLLAPNTAATVKFLAMTGTGTNGAAPAWTSVPAYPLGWTNIAKVAGTDGPVLKNTPVDADMFLLSNSASANEHSYTTGANLKTFIGTGSTVYLASPLWP